MPRPLFAFLAHGSVDCGLWTVEKKLPLTPSSCVFEFVDLNPSDKILATQTKRQIPGKRSWLSVTLPSDNCKSHSYRPLPRHTCFSKRQSRNTASLNFQVGHFFGARALAESHQQHHKDHVCCTQKSQCLATGSTKNNRWNQFDH